MSAVSSNFRGLLFISPWSDDAAETSRREKADAMLAEFRAPSPPRQEWPRFLILRRERYAARARFAAPIAVLVGADVVVWAWGCDNAGQFRSAFLAYTFYVRSAPRDRAEISGRLADPSPWRRPKPMLNSPVAESFEAGTQRNVFDGLADIHFRPSD
jgi:hypothetical protein